MDYLCCTQGHIRVALLDIGAPDYQVQHRVTVKSVAMAAIGDINTTPSCSYQSHQSRTETNIAAVPAQATGSAVLKSAWSVKSIKTSIVGDIHGA